MSFKKEVIERLDKITIELAINTKVLSDHHVRTSQIEARVVPLEQSHVFFNKLAKAIMGLVTIGASMTAILHYLVFK